VARARGDHNGCEGEQVLCHPRGHRLRRASQHRRHRRRRMSPCHEEAAWLRGRRPGWCAGAHRPRCAQGRDADDQGRPGPPDNPGRSPADPQPPTTMSVSHEPGPFAASTYKGNCFPGTVRRHVRLYGTTRPIHPDPLS
jgi:hypothetical protein